MKLLDYIYENPEQASKIRLEISGDDLIQFLDHLVETRLNLAKNQELKNNSEEYLTGDEMAKVLKISTVTLWHWDKKGITRPLRIGKAKRYRRSDLEKILNS